MSYNTTGKFVHYKELAKTEASMQCVNFVHYTTHPVFIYLHTQHIHTQIKLIL